MDNIEQILSVAVQTKSSTLHALCRDFMVRFFDNFIGTNAFLSLDVDILKEILCSDNLVAEKEEDKFLAISSWIFHTQNNEDEENIRLDHITDLMPSIYWPTVPAQFMIDQLGMNTDAANHPDIR